MTSISSLSGISSSLYSSSTQRSQRPDPSKMVDDLFSQLDKTGKGYLEVSDLQSALAKISSTSSSTSTSSSSSSSASASDVFAKLDSNGDGKVTKDEMTSGMKKLADELDSQFNQMRMSSSNGAPPPPPPQESQDDAGFSKDELSSQINQIGSTDSKRTDLMTKIVNNFDKADTNSDGKVSMKEAMAYDQSTSSSSDTSSSTTSSSSRTTSSDLAIMKRIMDLMQSYASNDTSSNSLLNTLSVSA